MSDTDSDILVSFTPPELKSIVNSALFDVIPKKSKRQYEKCYSEFKDWCDKQNVKTMSENILLAYLMRQSKVVKSSTLWSIYSMLKCFLNIREGIDVRRFLKLVPFLERKAVGYQAKKSKVFTREQIDSFLKEANDNKYLLLKRTERKVIAEVACDRGRIILRSLKSFADMCILVLLHSPELKSIVNSALSDVIPKKCKRQYEKCYSEFKDWCDKQNVKTMSENILLAYLMQQSKVVKSSTLWSIYSMLKCLLNIREGIDVRRFLKLVPFLERKAVGYQAKKSKSVFTREQIDSFLKEANDNKYLMLKSLCTPPELKSIVNSALSDFIPKKSKRQYEKCYSVLECPKCRSNIGYRFKQGQQGR
ncbi:hypothetical protein NQ317_008470 [Molorchus minor]|uniref:Uncharacterized protein n=1 Tax=Molorchus minor TaxID=1323400 RepID=A0ABQ9JEQ2_9CUCU|nr:hypothetical protein NQ317_008470 [Molorchus minor]